jgi:hypothetical protein
MDTYTWLIGVLGTLEIGILIAVSYYLSTLVGNPDTANDLAKSIIPVTGILGGIVMIHTLIWYMYFQYEPMAMNLYFLVSGSMTMIFSLVALSVSLISRA